MLQVLKDPKWPAKWPFRPSDFSRYDEAPDAYFYDQPRFVTHIDDYAIKALTKCVGVWGQGQGPYTFLCSHWPGAGAGTSSCKGSVAHVCNLVHAHICTAHLLHAHSDGTVDPR